MNKKYLRWLSYLFTSIIVLISFNVRAAELPIKNTVSSIKKDKKINFGVDVGGTYLSTDLDTVLGTLIKIDFKYAINKKWGIHFEASQAYDTEGFENIFTGFSLRGSYAWLGSQVRESESVQVSEYNVLTKTTNQQPLLLGELSVKQVFFNGSIRALPLIGPGLSMSYQFGSTKNYGYRIGASYDYLTNNKDEKINPVSISIGVLYWL